MDYNNSNLGSQLFKAALYLSGVKDIATPANTLENPILKKYSVSVSSAQNASGRAISEKPQVVSKEELHSDPRSMSAPKADQSKTCNSPALQQTVTLSDSNEAPGLMLDLSEKTILNAFIFSEVLGRPKCKRKGR